MQFQGDRLINGLGKSGTQKRYNVQIDWMSEDEIRCIHKKDGWLFNWKQGS